VLVGSILFVSLAHVLVSFDSYFRYDSRFLNLVSRASSFFIAT
jgi:hypothetical protein